MTKADWVGILTTVLSAGLGAWIAALVALNRWRAELTGRRRAELAEQVLADFYHFRAEMKGLPISLSWSDEKKYKDRVLSELRDFTSKIQSRRFQFSAVFGAEAAEPYDKLDDVYARFLLSAHKIEKFGADFDAAFEAFKPSPDVYERMDAAISRMEATCRAAINAEETRPRWPWQR